MKKKHVNIVVSRAGRQNHWVYIALKVKLIYQQWMIRQNSSRFFLLQNTSAAKHFRKNLLKYNSAFKKTSFGADKNMADFRFLTTYKIHRQCYFLMDGLLPISKESHKFLQIYFMDGDQVEDQQRCANVHNGLDLDIVMELREMFYSYHKYDGIFPCELEHLTLIKDEKNYHQSR